MCNNILQFAHVYAWALEHGRKALSMRFAYKYPYFRINSTRRHNFLSYLYAKYAAKLGLLPVVSFNTPEEYDPEAYRKKVLEMESRNNLIVEGWEVRFYDLFLRYKSEILNLFSFNRKVSDAVDHFFSKIPGSTKSISDFGPEYTLRVGIHIRRGDYARWHEGRYLFSDAQMADVCSRIADLYPDRPIAFCICGNDPQLDKKPYEALGRYDRRMSFHFAQGNPGEDLCMLSRCQLIAGAPSTFSLVASMYRDTPLYWISNPADTPRFGSFDRLFREII